MIPASAIVDTINPATTKGLGLFRVEVWGQEPNDYVRVYEIQAKSQDQAARSGIDKFVAEIEKLIASGE